jgi:hypothetical protein
MQDEADAQLKWIRADAMKALIRIADALERERCAKVALSEGEAMERAARIAPPIFQSKFHR